MSCALFHRAILRFEGEIFFTFTHWLGMLARFRLSYTSTEGMFCFGRLAACGGLLSAPFFLARRVVVRVNNPRCAEVVTFWSFVSELAMLEALASWSFMPMLNVSDSSLVAF